MSTINSIAQLFLIFIKYPETHFTGELLLHLIVLHIIVDKLRIILQLNIIFSTFIVDYFGIR